MTRRAPATALAAALALLGLMSACSSETPVTADGSGSTASSPSTPSRGQPVEPPVEQSWDLGTAGERYLNYVEPVNTTLDEVEAFNRANMDSSLTAEIGKQLNDLCQRWLDAEESLLRNLNAGAWPEQAQPQIDALKAAAAVTIADLQQCAVGETPQLAFEAYRQALNSLDGGEAVAVRVALDLPLPPSG